MTKLINVNVHGTFHVSKELSDELKACCNSQLLGCTFLGWERSLCTTEKACHVVKSFHRVHFANLYLLAKYLLVAGNCLASLHLQHFCFTRCGNLGNSVEIYYCRRNVDYVFVNHLGRPFYSYSHWKPVLNLHLGSLQHFDVIASVGKQVTPANLFTKYHKSVCTM